MNLCKTFFSRDKVIDFFQLVRNLSTCSNLTCYAKNNTLVMYLSMKKKNFQYECAIKLQFFKVKGPLDIKGDGPFWYPNSCICYHYKVMD